jgi:hypothetical protein
MTIYRVTIPLDENQEVRSCGFRFGRRLKNYGSGAKDSDCGRLCSLTPHVRGTKPSATALWEPRSSY